MFKLHDIFLHSKWSNCCKNHLQKYSMNLPLLKIRQSWKQIMVSILPNNERWDNFQYIKLSQSSFFGIIVDTIICFPDCLTFRLWTVLSTENNGFITCLNSKNNKYCQPLQMGFLFRVLQLFWFSLVESCHSKGNRFSQRLALLF